jgi:fructose/tagatose bisphosphate aldolase
MIGVIIGLFQQIAGVIGVPGIPYPLSLLPDCISAMPKIIDVVQKVPVMMYAAVKGLIKDKLAEAMALSIPKPNIDLDTLKSLIPEIEDPVPDKPSSQSKPETKKKDYTDVVKEKYEELNAIDGRYSRTDV